jgi:hypothetical protein
LRDALGTDIGRGRDEHAEKAGHSRERDAGTVRDDHHVPSGGGLADHAFD